jgi:hypothetical protein
MLNKTKYESAKNLMAKEREERIMSATKINHK